MSAAKRRAKLPPFPVEPGRGGFSCLMKVTISIQGATLTKKERITCELIVPDGWKPSFSEFCKVKGCVRMLSEKLSQEFAPKVGDN